MKIYLIGSLRNSRIPLIGRELRERTGCDVFDDWYAPGERADDCWREYEQARGRTYREALNGHAAQHIFDFDKAHIDSADIGVLVAPAGKSGHLELGYMAKDKPTFMLLDEDPDRWDVMVKFVRRVCFSVDELVDAIARVAVPPRIYRSGTFRFSNVSDPGRW